MSPEKTGGDSSRADKPGRRDSSRTKVLKHLTGNDSDVEGTDLKEVRELSDDSHSIVAHLASPGGEKLRLTSAERSPGRKGVEKSPTITEVPESSKAAGPRYLIALQQMNAALALGQ